MTTEVICSVSIEAKLALRDAVIGKLAEAKALFDEANRLSVQAGFGELDAAGRYYHSRDTAICAANFMAEQTKVIDAKAWDFLLKESGILSFMHSEARSKWCAAISEKKTLPLTRSAIESTFGELYRNRTTMLEDGVINVFKSLSWDFKSNNPRMLGKRIIITTGSSDFQIYEKPANGLDDLERAMSVLDGKPQADHRHGWQYQKFIGGEHSTEYLRVKRFAKGTAHVYFLRPDLVDQLNKIIAKRYPNALPRPDKA